MRKLISKKDILFLLIVFAGIQTYRSIKFEPIIEQNFNITTQMNLIDGHKEEMNQLKTDQVKLLYIFAPWCPVCKWTTSNAKKVQEWFNIPTFFVGASYNDPKEIRDYKKEFEVPSSIYSISDEDLEKLKIKGFPTFIFIKNGKIKHYDVGYSTTIGLWLRSQWVQYMK